MKLAGGVIGPAFALEGYAFFIEAIFLGLYLYGWDRLSPRAHWLSGFAVAISGLLSGILVVAANAWMQAPVDFTLGPDGSLASSHALATFRTPAWIHMAVHSSLSCYIATAFAVAGVYALGMLRGRANPYHRSGLGIALAVGTITALAQPLSGDWSARSMAEYQPAKLAAAEAHFHTSSHVPLLIGGIPDTAGNTRYALRIPSGLSFLVGRSPNTVVVGLDRTPLEERPPVLIAHVAFQLMVACGLTLIAVGVLFWVGRRRQAEPRWLLRFVLLAAPLGFVALEAGWVLTEVGRQPWMIYGVMRTAEGVTPRADVTVTFVGFTLLYLALGGALVGLLRGLAKRSRVPAGEAARVA
jgi:cytochrome d ubiquinol oxidase subunit I